MLNEFNRALLVALINDRFTSAELRALVKQPHGSAGFNLTILDQSTNLRIIVSKCHRRGVQRHVHLRILCYRQKPIDFRIDMSDFQISNEEL